MAACFQPKPVLRPLQTLNPAAAPRRSPHVFLRRCHAAPGVRCSSAAPPRRSYSVTILPGDGIGPEVVSVARDVLFLAGSLEGIEFRFREMPVGGAALDAVGVPLPEETLSVAKASDAVLLGAIGGSVLYARWVSAVLWFLQLVK